MRRLLAIPLAFALAGCPTPPEEGPAGGPGAPPPGGQAGGAAGGPPAGGQNGGPGGQNGGPGGPGAQPPGEGGAPPAGGAGGAGGPPPGGEGAAANGEGGPPPTDGAGGATAPPNNAPPAGGANVMVFYVDTARLEAGDGQFLAGMPREVATDKVIRNALDALYAGPTEDEKGRGIEFMNSGSSGWENFQLEGTVLTVQLKGGCDSGGASVTVAEQLFRTVTQFREVETVKLLGPDGKTQEPDGVKNSRPACLEP